MAKDIKTMKSDDVSGLMVRNYNREGTIAEVVISLIGYYVALGDTETEAKDKADQISYDILKNDLYCIEGYERGNARCKADLIIAINALSEITYPFFDAAAKEFTVSQL